MLEVNISVISSIAWYILSLRLRNQETLTVLGFCYLGVAEKISWGHLALTLESLVWSLPLCLLGI